MRIETACSGCRASVLVLTLEPGENETTERCRVRMTRAAGWRFTPDGQPLCSDCPDVVADPVAPTAPAKRRKK